MFSKNFPFFSIENKIKSINYYDCQFNFYHLEINQENILFGQCFKNVNSDNQKIISEKMLKHMSFWAKEELDEMKTMKNKKQFSRLYEWILTKILVKFGASLYLRKYYTQLDISSDQITIIKDKWNRPSIKFILNNDIIKLDLIPFISISHTKYEVYISLCSKPIGIDNELLAFHSKSWERKIFNRKESEKIINYLKRWNIFSKDLIYTIMWSLKESTIKVEGTIPLGLLSKVSIDIMNDNIITKIPQKNRSYKNFISLTKDSVLILTI